MARNISFFLTKDQFRQQIKYVTRRSAWDGLSPGTILMGCEKCQGLGKGGTITRLGKIRILDVRSEPLYNITKSDVVLEGFPKMTRAEFISMYMKANKKACPFQSSKVNRIEYEYLEPRPIFSPGHLWTFSGGLNFYFVAIAGGYVWGSYKIGGKPVRIELANFLWQINKQWIIPLGETSNNYFPEIQTMIRRFTGDLNK